MLKINRLLFCICMLAIALPVVAQQPDAKEVLDRTAETFKKSGGVKISFTVRAPGGSSTGTIRLKGDKFLLESDGATTWFDGHTQWSYLSSSDEVNISEPTPEELQNINPYALLSLYERGYRLKMGEVDNPRLKSLYKVVLTATERKTNLQCIILYVTKDTYRPTHVSMAQRGGDAAVIIINSYQTGETYPDSLFVFDKKAYPTAELIDLR
ncbi:LolA-like putative outer membrane lipoprotein chaperone [Bacteroides heparinolyticus]